MLKLSRRMAMNMNLTAENNAGFIRQALGGTWSVIQH